LGSPSRTSSGRRCAAVALTGHATFPHGPFTYLRGKGFSEGTHRFAVGCSSLGTLSTRFSEQDVHVLGDRGTIWMELADVQRFESGVVLLTYLPAT